MDSLTQPGHAVSGVNGIKNRQCGMVDVLLFFQLLAKLLNIHRLL